MTEQRIVWDGYLSLAIPVGWEWEEDDGIISIYDPDGVGVVQISFATSHAEHPVIDVGEFTKFFVEAQGFEDVRLARTMITGLLAGYFEGSPRGDEPSLWRVWSVGRNGRVATISYTCSEEDRELERSPVDDLIRSIQWLLITDAGHLASKTDTLTDESTAYHYDEFGKLPRR